MMTPACRNSSPPAAPGGAWAPCLSSNVSCAPCGARAGGTAGSGRQPGCPGAADAADAPNSGLQAMEAGCRSPLLAAAPTDAQTPRVQPNAAPSARRHAVGKRAWRARPAALAASSRRAGAAAPSAAADASEVVQLGRAHAGKGSAKEPRAGALCARRGDVAFTGGAACFMAAEPLTRRSSTCSAPHAAASAGSSSSAVRGAGPPPAAALPNSAGDAARKDGGHGPALPGEGGAPSACGAPGTAASRGCGRGAPAHGGATSTAGRCRGRGWPVSAEGVSCA